MENLAWALVIVTAISATTYSDIRDDDRNAELAIAAANNLCDYSYRDGGGEVIIDCKGARESQKVSDR